MKMKESDWKNKFDLKAKEKIKSIFKEKCLFYWMLDWKQPPTNSYDFQKFSIVYKSFSGKTNIFPILAENLALVFNLEFLRLLKQNFENPKEKTKKYVVLDKKESGEKLFELLYNHIIVALMDQDFETKSSNFVVWLSYELYLKIAKHLFNEFKNNYYLENSFKVGFEILGVRCIGVPFLGKNNEYSIHPLVLSQPRTSDKINLDLSNYEAVIFEEVQIKNTLLLKEYKEVEDHNGSYCHCLALVFWSNLFWINNDRPQFNVYQWVFLNKRIEAEE